MDKIQESNKLLDALQRKMQNHFTKHHASQNQSHQQKNGIDSYYLTDHHHQSKERIAIPANQRIQSKIHTANNSHKEHLNYQPKVNERNPFMKYALDSVNDQQENQMSSRPENSYLGQLGSNLNRERYDLHQPNDRYFVPPEFKTNNKSDPHLLTSNYTEENQFSGNKIESLIQKYENNYRGQQPRQNQKANLRFIPGKIKNKLSYANQREHMRGNHQIQRPRSTNAQQQDMKQQTFKLFNKKKDQDKARLQSMDAQITQNTPNKSYGGSNINVIQKSYAQNQYQFVNPRTHNSNSNVNPINATHSMSQSNHLRGFENIQTIESLLQQKIKIKEATVKQLESELRLQNQQKVYLYKVNVKLQEQFRNQSQQIKQKQDDQVKGLTFLVQRLKRLKAQSLLQKKSLIKQQQILSEQHKQLIRGRKQFLKYDKQVLERELNLGKKTKSKSCFQNAHLRKYTTNSGVSHTQIADEPNRRKNNQLLLELVGQLDRLKNVVQRKVKQTQKLKPYIK